MRRSYEIQARLKKQNLKQKLFNPSRRTIVHGVAALISLINKI